VTAPRRVVPLQSAAISMLPTCNRRSMRSYPRGDALWEESAYLSQQLVTYIGNKRAMLGPIEEAIKAVQQRTGRTKLRILDAFSGSGVVSRMLKQHASELIVNDLEDYARCVSECYLANRSGVDTDLLIDRADQLNRAVAARRVPSGFFRRLYAPGDAGAITGHDRVFYTPDTLIAWMRTGNSSRTRNHRSRLCSWGRFCPKRRCTPIRPECSRVSIRIAAPGLESSVALALTLSIASWLRSRFSRRF
jgi:D12 class N6 adenine-specific DNA methyltransferase